MASIDVFRGDAFSMTSLLAAIENIDYNPQFLGSLNLFQSEPQRTRDVWVEERDGELALIPTSPIGAPPVQRGKDARRGRSFRTVRLAKGSVITADQIQGIRAFGSETELQSAQTEVASRMQRLMSDLELTWEHHRLGAVQGLLLDADGTTIYNYFTEFGVAQPDEVAFDFSTLANGAVRTSIEADIVRPMIRAAKGAFTTGSRIIALCGDDFWDEFIANSEVRQSYLNWEAAAALREGTAFGTFRYAGVEWINYRGTDDQSTVGIATDEAKFFPAGANGVFQVAWAPAEFMDAVNMPGRDVWPLVLPDASGRNAHVTVELYSYPLFLCTRPLTLRRARLAT